MAKPDIRKRLVNQVFDQLEKEYLKERKGECEVLHNALVGAIAEQEASPQNVLLVLKMLEAETIDDCKKRFFSEPEKVESQVSDKAPTTIGS